MTSTPSIAKDGFFIVRNVLHSNAITHLVEASVLPEDGRGGVRNLLDIPAFRALANSAQIRALIEPILGAEAFPVRGILFDKTGNANWKVPWHQDVTIAVTNKVDAAGYGPWSVKAGVQHVQPPPQILENMLSVRIHLDDCPAVNGALRVLPATHLHGKLSQAKIESAVLRKAPVTCEASAGDALLMRPLLVHASSPSSTPSHRRVIHFDYANVDLADGLGWRERCATGLSESKH
jgi:ectoine hydroxylase-related dioxygenase (phytanoyl-CoA dioxygenase family)